MPQVGVIGDCPGLNWLQKAMNLSGEMGDIICLLSLAICLKWFPGRGGLLYLAVLEKARGANASLSHFL